MTKKNKLSSSEKVSEGDINLSPQRKAWSEAHINKETKNLLSEDAKYFLHQSLSSPCLNVLTNSEGIYLKDLQGRDIMDFHGNSVHQVGYGNPKVIKQIIEIEALSRNIINTSMGLVMENINKVDSKTDVTVNRITNYRVIVVSLLWNIIVIFILMKLFGMFLRRIN